MLVRVKFANEKEGKNNKENNNNNNNTTTTLNKNDC